MMCATRSEEFAVSPHSTTLAAMQVIFNCPACGQKSVPGFVILMHESTHLVIHHKTTWVQCSACQSRLLSRAKPIDLEGLTPTQLESIIIRPVSFVGRVCALLSVPLCLLPFIGLFTSVIALVMTWRTKSWARSISRWTVGISAATSLFGIVMILIAKK